MSTRTPGSLRHRRRARKPCLCVSTVPRSVKGVCWRGIAAITVDVGQLSWGKRCGYKIAAKPHEPIFMRVGSTCGYESRGTFLSTRAFGYDSFEHPNALGFQVRSHGICENLRFRDKMHARFFRLSLNPQGKRPFKPDAPRLLTKIVQSHDLS